MERREAPGVCETPWGRPLRSEHPARRHERVCETRSEARASCGDRFARPAARTLRLPALHRDAAWGGIAPGLHARRTGCGDRSDQADANISAVWRAGITFFSQAVEIIESVPPLGDNRAWHPES